MAMSENVNLAWKLFDDLGYNDVAKSALLGNAMQESYADLRPTAFNKNENAFGIFQWRDTSGTNDSGVSWNSPRIQWLNKFAEINNLDPNDIKTQVLYTDWELRSKFRDTYDKLQSDNLKDISGATKLIDSSYVYSAGGTIDERIKNANQVFKNLSGVNTNQNINTDYLDLDSTLVDDPEKLINTNYFLLCRIPR